MHGGIVRTREKLGIFCCIASLIFGIFGPSGRAVTHLNRSSLGTPQNVPANIASNTASLGQSIDRQVEGFHYAAAGSEGRRVEKEPNA